MPFNNIMNVFKRRMMKSKIEYDNAAKAIQEVIDLEGIVARRSNCWNTYREAQIRFSNIEQKEIPMNKMTRQEAIDKITKLDISIGPSKLVDALTELGLIELKKEGKTAEELLKDNLGDRAGPKMKEILEQYGYQIIKKQEPCIVNADTPVRLTYGFRTTMGEIVNSLENIGYSIFKKTTVNFEPNPPGL